MPTVGSWWEFDVICSAITALIQCTKPWVGFWLCTPPTGMAGKPVAEHVVVDAVVGTGELPGTGVVFVASIVLLLLLLLLLLFVDWFVELIPESPLHANAATAAFWKESFCFIDNLLSFLFHCKTVCFLRYTIFF